MFEETFGEKYYQTNNYTDYLGRGDRYIRLANEVSDFLGKMNLNKGPVLDFGCAVGFLLEGLKDKHEAVYGVDISEYALEVCREKGLDVRDAPLFDTRHGIVYGLDVFEHMDEDELNAFFARVDTKVIVFRMPICAEGEDDYHLEVSRRDPTHVIKWTKSQWQSYFKKYGYLPLDLELSTIYNSTGVYSGVAICTTDWPT